MGAATAGAGVSPVEGRKATTRAFVPTANPADAPAINLIANRDFSEEPQKLGLNLLATNAWLFDAGQSSRST